MLRPYYHTGLSTAEAVHQPESRRSQKIILQWPNPPCLLVIQKHSSLFHKVKPCASPQDYLNMWDNIVLCHWGWNVSLWQWATNPFSQIDVWQCHNRYDKCTIQQLILWPNRGRQRILLLKFKGATVNIFILTMEGYIPENTQCLTHAFVSCRSCSI